MFTLRATAKLLKQLKVRPESSPPRSSAALGDWYANLIYVDRQQLILCVSEVTLLPVILRARGDEPLAARLPSAVGQILAALGVPNQVVRREVAEMNQVTVAGTASRVVLGTTNDFMRMLPAYFERRGTLQDVALKLAEAPCGPLEMHAPKEATVDLLARVL